MACTQPNSLLSQEPCRVDVPYAARMGLPELQPKIAPAGNTQAWGTTCSPKPRLRDRHLLRLPPD